MKPNETILFSDLDGTLFNSRNRISPENLAAIHAYIEAGGRFAVATGRAPQNALGFLHGLRQNAPAIVLNGAGAYDFRRGRYLFCAHMDRQSLDPLLRGLLAEIPGLEVQVYTEEEILYCLPEERCQPTLLRLHRPCRFVDFSDTLGLPVVKCLLYVAPERDAALGRALGAAAPGRFALAPAEIRVAGEELHFYEIMPLGVSKAHALHRLRQTPELAGRTVFAAGDNWNDLELLRAADVAVTPANAVPEAKAISRFTTVSNEQHAIAALLGEILPSL
ncbi:MAG: Cof-type HAD-IIB family hydrolase [Oscillospiraceae bacterium]|nr:Cof-type HAD-IIB family hydrolase [Oscillospiraceae bacterium]